MEGEGACGSSCERLMFKAHRTCPARELTLCIHIMIAMLSHAYTFEELQAFGFNGSGLDMLFKTFRGS